MSDQLLICIDFAREMAVNIMVVAFYTAFGRFVLGVVSQVKTFLLCCGMHSCVHIVVRYLMANAPFGFILMAADMIVMCRILWNPTRGLTFWTNFIFAMVAEIFVCECLVMNILISVIPDAGKVATVSGFTLYILIPHSYVLLFSLLVGSMALLIVTMVLFRRLSAYIRRRCVPVAAMLRFVVFLALLMSIMVVAGRQLNAILCAENATNALPYVLCYGTAVALLLFHLWQDFQRIMLHRENRSLLEKNEAYRRIVESNREYRHNMANMLYGLEGIIMTRDVEHIERFYTDMARRCAELNNENVVALDRLQDQALVTLLLRKLDEASNMHVPFRISADISFAMNELSSTELCEVMGNLIDNALEAAVKSSTPLVNLTLHMDDDYNEILLANTYGDDADMAFLTDSYISSKPGHQAEGLASVRRIMSNCRKTALNMYRHGRYVEASICEYLI